MEAWLEDPIKEINNIFLSYDEFLFKSDPSWVVYEYGTSIPIVTMTVCQEK
jgi:hypothetical protein